MEPIIELQGLNYRYRPDSDRQALTNVSTTIYRGEWIVVIGHNGSGKINTC